LGSTVTTAEGLVEIESTLQYLNIDNISIDGNTITTVSGNLILNAAGTIDFSGNTLTGVQDINYASSPDDSVANKKYVDERVLNRPLTLTLDISDFNVATQNGMEAANDKIVEILTYTASIFNSTTNPQGVSIEGTIAKVHASHTSVTLAPIQYQPVQVGTPLTGTETLAYEKDTVNKGASTENKSVVSDIVAIQSIPSPAATVNVQRFYKRFEVIEQPDNTLAWEFVTDFNPVGVWDNLTAYSVNDLVLYNNQEWICIIGVNAGGLNPAADVVNWKLFANI
jgi:hypothetical protein